jgi:hypothetical protein
MKAKDPPEIVAAKVELIKAQASKMLEGTQLDKAKKVKTNIEASFGAMQAAEVVAAVPGVAPVADMLMRSAGYTPPTPPGIDPGFAPGDQGPNNSGAPITPDPALTIEPVTNKRTGVGFTPGGAQPAGEPDREPGVPPSTNPMTPKPMMNPASPFKGENAGIETMRGDTKGPKR